MFDIFKDCEFKDDESSHVNINTFPHLGNPVLVQITTKMISRSGMRFGFYIGYTVCFLAKQLVMGNRLNFASRIMVKLTPFFLQL